MALQILVIEDDKRLAQTIGDVLQSVGLEVEYCYNGEEGLEQSFLKPYGLVILDVMLPKLDGFSVAKELRSGKNTVPILMLTAKSEVSDRVEGLNSGADYYLTKPFHAEELISCVHALLRRQGMEDGALSFGNTVLKLNTDVLVCGDNTVRLSAKEFQIMECLLRAKERTLSKEYLLTTVWGYDTEATENHVEVYISMLRKKLKVIDSNLKITAIFKIGYHLVVDAHA